MRGPGTLASSVLRNALVVRPPRVLRWRAPSPMAGGPPGGPTHGKLTNVATVLAAHARQHAACMYSVCPWTRHSKWGMRRMHQLNWQQTPCRTVQDHHHASSQSCGHVLLATAALVLVPAAASCQLSCCTALLLPMPVACHWPSTRWCRSLAFARCRGCGRRSTKPVWFADCLGHGRGSAEGAPVGWGWEVGLLGDAGECREGADPCQHGWALGPPAKWGALLAMGAVSYGTSGAGGVACLGHAILGCTLHVEVEAGGQRRNSATGIGPLTQGHAGHEPRAPLITTARRPSTPQGPRPTQAHPRSPASPTHPVGNGSCATADLLPYATFLQPASSTAV